MTGIWLVLKINFIFWQVFDWSTKACRSRAINYRPSRRIEESSTTFNPNIFEYRSPYDKNRTRYDSGWEEKGGMSFVYIKKESFKEVRQLLNPFSSTFDYGRTFVLSQYLPRSSPHARKHFWQLISICWSNMSCPRDVYLSN